MEDHFPPFLFSGLRFIISGAIILIWFMLTGKSIAASGRDFRRILISGLFIFTGGNLFLVLAEQTVPSGLAALINAAFPLWIVVITRLWNPVEKTPFLALVGILVGFIGQWLIFYDNIFLLGNTAYMSGLILVIWGVINGSFGSIHMKKYPVGLSPVLTGGWQMFICGIFTSIIGVFKGEWSSLPHHFEGWWPMIYLIVAGSVLGYSFFVYALRYLPAQQVSVYAYVNPIVAVFLGWLLLDETISEKSVYAMGITIIGVFLVNKGMQRNKIPA